MTEEHIPETAAPEGSPTPENKARAAFEEYKRRMDARAARFAGGIPVSAGQPFPPPFSYGMPAWTFPPPPAPMPGAPTPPYAMPGSAERLASRTKSLLGSIGDLVQSSIDAVNLGLAGGIQLMEGLWGPGTLGPGPHAYGPPPPYPQPGCHGCSGYYDCCCDPCCGHCGCNPSVHNCY